MNILITGGLGKTAEPIIDLLCTADHQIIIFDNSPNSLSCFNKDIRVIQGDIRNYDEIDQAVRGIDIVIHLAVNVSDTHNDELTFQTNVFGTYNILRCSQNNGIHKVLIASSAPVHTAKELAQPTGGRFLSAYLCSPGEDFSYDLTKNIQEVIAQHFSQTYGMNSLVLRLGHIVDGNNDTDLYGVPLSEISYCIGGWVCKHDVARAFSKAVETSFSGFHLINIIGSYQAVDAFDLSAGKELIDFECAERFLGYRAV